MKTKIAHEAKELERANTASPSWEEQARRRVRSLVFKSIKAKRVKRPPEGLVAGFYGGSRSRHLRAGKNGHQPMGGHCHFEVAGRHRSRSNTHPWEDRQGRP